MPVTIRAQNFQSIQDATIEVDHLTVVTGTNNSGKSSLQRAARAVFQNTGGTAFIRHGETSCSVEVDFGPDGKIKWSKGTGKRDRPTYVINDGDPIYPGSAVPDEVAAFGVIPIQAGGQDVWPTLAPQFTGQVFLIDRPGSALAEAVADVERVGQLNRALRASESDRRQAAAALKVRTADLVRHENDLRAFDGLDDAVTALCDLESQRAGVLRVSRALDGLLDIRRRLLVARSDALRLAPVTDIPVPGAQGLSDALTNVDTLRDTRDRLKAARGNVARYQGIDSVLVDVSARVPEKVSAAITALRSLQENIKETGCALVACQGKLDRARLDLSDASKDIGTTLAGLGQCPVCGGPV